MPFFVGSGCVILKNDVGMGEWRNREGQWNVRDGASVMSGSAGPSAATALFGRGLLMEVTQEVQSGPLMVPVGPMWCRNGDPTCDTSFSVFIIRSRRGG